MPTVVVADLDPGVRARPRAAHVLGVGRTGVAYTVESTSTSQPAAQVDSTRWRSDSGVDVLVHAGTTEEIVVGDRLVRPPSWVDGHQVVRTLRLENPPPGGWSDADWVDSSLPTPSGYVAPSGDGALVYLPSGGPGGSALHLLPWDGGPAVLVTGLPEGAVASELPSWFLQREPMSDAHGVLVQVRDGGWEAWAYVDTVSATATLLPQGGYRHALGPESIAWLDGATTAGATVVTVARPAPGTELPPTLDAGLRSVTMTGDPPCQVEGCRLAPLADAVLLTAPRTPMPVTRVADDGITTVLPAGTDAFAAPGGGWYAVSAGSARTAAIVHAAQDGAPVAEAVPLPPVPAHVATLALDGSRLVTADDTAEDGAVVERQVTGGLDGPVVSPPDLLGTGVRLWGRECGAAPCATVAAGSGGTAWVGQDRTTSAYTVTARSADGDDGHPAADTLVRPAPVRVLALRRRRVGRRRRRPRRRPDRGRPRRPCRVRRRAGPGPRWRGADRHEPHRRSTARRRILPDGPVDGWHVAGCELSELSTAGSWLLARCSRDDGSTLVVVNRRDGHTVDLGWEDVRWLGDGFVVRLGPAGQLEWSGLDADVAAWHPVGGPHPRGTERAGEQPPWVAVSRTGPATLAWVDDQDVTHVALLPVSSSGPLAAPDGSQAVPAAPNPTWTDLGHGQVRLSWAPVRSHPALLRYVVHDVHTSRDVTVPSGGSQVVVSVPSGEPGRSPSGR